MPSTTTTTTPTIAAMTTTTPGKEPEVPTKVAAGIDGENGIGGPLGVLLGVIAAVAGLAIVARRRFLRDS